jgi:HAD superfamily hydrolase (TIGR01509 family)
MKPNVLFIGSIGAIAETSEYQRQAYNQALEENGINWQWDKETYQRLLKSNGGQDRLDMLGHATGKPLTKDQIKKVHTRKTELAGQHIRNNSVQPRPGVAKLIKEAKESGAKVAWVTTTGKENTEAILQAFNGEIRENDFDHIFHREDADHGKPQPDIYYAAMKKLDVKPEQCVAIEDSLNSALAAKGAGVYTVVHLGEYHNENVKNIAHDQFDNLEATSWKQLQENCEKSTQIAVG